MHKFAREKIRERMCGGARRRNLRISAARFENLCSPNVLRRLLKTETKFRREPQHVKATHGCVLHKE